MDTKTAFTDFLSSPTNYKRANLTHGQAAVLRNRHKSGQVTTKKMVELLTAAGYVIKTQIEWATPQQVTEALNK